MKAAKADWVRKDVLLLVLLLVIPLALLLLVLLLLALRLLPALAGQQGASNVQLRGDGVQAGLQVLHLLARRRRLRLRLCTSKAAAASSSQSICQGRGPAGAVPEAAQHIIQCAREALAPTPAPAPPP